MKNLKMFEEWDPSMSYDPTAPFNEPEDFIDKNQEAFIEIEKVLGKRHGLEVPQKFWDDLTERDNDKIYNRFNDEMESKFAAIFDKEYAPDEYRTRKEMDRITLDIAKKHADDFLPIYKEALEALGFETK